VARSTVGLGFTVSWGRGIAACSALRANSWVGHATTFFWVDPNEKLVAVFHA
jgi:hypothetical protein